MKSLTVALLALIDQSYDNYNTVLRDVKNRLEHADLVGNQRIVTFERVLAEELPLTSARHAYRAAICEAMGEETGFVRERVLQSAGKKFNGLKK